MPYANKEDKARNDKKYGAKPEQKKRRAERNRARREWLKKMLKRMSEGEAKQKMKGKDVHHTDGNKPPSPKIGGKTRLIDGKKNKDWTL
jgi:hypothetical protein